MSDTDDAWFNLESVYAALADNRRIVPTFKAALADAASVLDGKFSAGVDVEALLHGRTRFVDELLRLAWSRFEWNENRGSFWKNRRNPTSCSRSDPVWARCARCWVISSTEP